MKNTMDYKHFTGTIEIDEKKKTLYGKVLGTNPVLRYEATNASDLIKAFHDVVDDYFYACEAAGFEPKTTYTGNLGLMVSSVTHRLAAKCAFEQGLSLNKFGEQALKNAIRDHLKESEQ